MALEPTLPKARTKKIRLRFLDSRLSSGLAPLFLAVLLASCANYQALHQEHRHNVSEIKVMRQELAGLNQQRSELLARRSALESEHRAARNAAGIRRSSSSSSRSSSRPPAAVSREIAQVDREIRQNAQRREEALRVLAR